MVIMFFLQGCSTFSGGTSENKNEKAEIYYGRGTGDLVGKDYTAALKNLLSAYELDPDNSNYANNLGMAYFFKGQTNLALDMLQKSLDLDKNNSDARLNLASIYLSQNKLEEAEKEYLKVSEDLIYAFQFRVFYNLGLLKLKMGEHDLAKTYFEKSIQDNKSYCPSHYQLGLIHYSVKNWYKAYKSFYSASRGNCFKEPLPLYYQAQSLFKLGKKSFAKIKFNEFVTRFPEHEKKEECESKLAQLIDVKVDELFLPKYNELKIGKTPKGPIELFNESPTTKAQTDKVDKKSSILE